VATSSDRWTLYHRTPDGEIPVVDFTRTGDEWAIAMRDSPWKDAIERALPTISLYRLRRGVRPDEGDLYLQALQQTFGRSSGWALSLADADEA
jgi:hypothetical protein